MIWNQLICVLAATVAVTGMPEETTPPSHAPAALDYAPRDVHAPHAFDHAPTAGHAPYIAEDAGSAVTGADVTGGPAGELASPQLRTKRGSGVVIRGPFYPYPQRSYLRYTSAGPCHAPLPPLLALALSLALPYIRPLMTL